MSMAERLAFVLSLDADGAIRGFKKVGDTAERELGRTEDRLDRMGGRLQVMGAGAMAFAGVAGSALLSLVDDASALEQAIGGTEAVFGEASRHIDDFAGNSAEAMGLTEAQFRQATTSIGGNLARMGFDLDTAAGHAIDLTQVGADLAATYGGTTEEAVNALGAAFRGEADPAERFNLNLKASVVAAKAVEMGLATSTASVSEYARAQAIMALIMEQSTAAQGQFARESDTTAGRLAIAEAKIGDFKAALGGAVAQAVAPAAEAVGNLAGKFNELDPATQKLISQVAVGVVGITGLAGAASFAAGSALKMADNFRRVRDAIASGGGLLTMVKRMSPALLGVGAAVGVAAIALNDYNKTKAEAARLTGEFTRALAEETQGVVGSVEALIAHELAAGGLGDALASVGADFTLLTDQVRNNGEAIEALDNQAEDLALGTISLGQALENAGLAGTPLGNELLRITEAAGMNRGEVAALVDQLDGLSDRHDDAAATAGNVAVAEEQLGVSIDTATGAVTEQSAALRTTNDRLEENRRRNEEAREAIEDRTEATIDAIGGDIAYRDAVRDANEALAEYAELAADGETASEDLAVAQDDAAQAAIDQAQAAADLARETAEANGQQQTAAERARIIRDELQRVADTLLPGSPLRVQLEGYIDQLNRIPRTVSTRLSVQYAEGSLPLPAAGTGPRAFADGGRPRVGELSVVGEEGPELFVPDTAGTIIPNHKLGGGTDVLLGASRIGSAAPIVNIYVSGSVIAEADLITKIQRGLVEAQRRNPSLAFQ